MKKIFEKIIEGILTCSGFVTSITILLIVLFLFTEAFGLFNSKVIEEGYVSVSYTHLSISGVSDTIPI